jgi:hypothetical protein
LKFFQNGDFKLADSLPSQAKVLAEFFERRLFLECENSFLQNPKGAIIESLQDGVRGAHEFSKRQRRSILGNLDSEHQEDSTPEMRGV